MVMRLQVALLITHHHDELLLLCCTSMMRLLVVKLITHHYNRLALFYTSVMRLELEVLITMMSWYYCSGCSQDLLDDIQIAPIHDDKFLAIYFELQQSVLMVYDLQLFLHRAILPKEKSCLELKKS